MSNVQSPIKIAVFVQLGAVHAAHSFTVCAAYNAWLGPGIAPGP